VCAVRYKRNFIWCLQNFRLEVGQGKMLRSVSVILHIQSLTRQLNAERNMSYKHISFERMTWISTPNLFFFQYHLSLLHADDVTFPASEQDAFNTSRILIEISSQIRNPFRL